MQGPFGLIGQLSGHLGGHQRAQFPAGGQVLPAGRPGDADRRADRPPPQAGGDRLHRATAPVVVLELPAEAQSIIAGYVAAVGDTLMMHWRVTGKGKDA